MATKNYCVRLNDEALINEVSAYAETHGVPESVALARLLAEGRNARLGKPIVRFAALDPHASVQYSLALGELRDLHRVLKHCVAALKLPRPLVEKERATWEAEKKQATDAFAAVKPKIDALSRAGHLELLLNDYSVKDLEKHYKTCCEQRISSLVVILGTLLGKPATLPKLPEAPKPAATPANKEAPQSATAS